MAARRGATEAASRDDRRRPVSAATRPRTSASGAQLEILRVVGRIDQPRGRSALAQNVDGELGTGRGAAGLDVADREALLQHMPVAAGGRAADHGVIGPEDRLVAERVGVRDAVDLEREEAIGHAGGELFLERLAADERTLAHSPQAIEPSLELRVVALQITPPHAVGLLEAE